MSFDFATCSAQGRSSGILGVWDKVMFQMQHTYSMKSCLCVEGTWMSTNTNLLFMSIYAPQDISRKRQIWLYVSGMINRWNGEVLVMRDFTEVRYAYERFGSIFQAAHAVIYNTFIEESQLFDIPLEGYSFTWSDTHGCKMSKLDRFLESEGVLETFLNFSSVILHRNLSDHKSILLRETNLDYGPTPFCKGLGSTIDVANRANAFWSIVEMDQKIVIDFAQQAKIKWAIEGDENSNFFHDPEWVRPSIDEIFQKWLGDDHRLELGDDHRLELEHDVAEVEIKNAIWDCGSDKSNSFPNGCNPSFISLIPKVIDAKIIDEFRPINLIGCQYRIISKILTNRLSTVVDELVSYEKLAFIKGRQILDGPLILNEVISWCKARNEVKIGDNMSRINSWREVILKVVSKLSKWKAKTLSVGGKLTLIKSVLGAIPTYFMSLYKRFLNSQSGFWQSIIKVIYGPNGSLDEPIPRCTCGLVWVAIHNSIDTLKSKGVDLMQFCNKVIGNGSSTSCWHERWNEILALKRDFIDLSSARKVIDKHLLDKLLTRSNLSYRGVDVPFVLCPVCASKVESRNHVFSGALWCLKYIVLLDDGGVFIFLCLVILLRGRLGSRICVLLLCISRCWKPHSSHYGGMFGVLEMPVCLRWKVPVAAPSPSHLHLCFNPIAVRSYDIRVAEVLKHVLELS
nr:RNA-directed DNA polymerase, eukaryota [Tanacetum cinerariifolium]